MTADTDLGMTSQEIYDRFKIYQQYGLLNYVLPTKPLGEQWVLGLDDLPLAKLMGDGDAIVFIAATENMIRFMAKRMGIRL